MSRAQEHAEQSEPGFTTHPEESLEHAIENIKDGRHISGRDNKTDANGELIERYSDYGLWEGKGDSGYTLLKFVRWVKRGERWLSYETVARFERSVPENVLRNRLINGYFPYSTVLDVLQRVDQSRLFMPCYREFIKEPASVLTLAGECGTGKTYGAVWLAYELLRLRKIRSVGFVKAADLDGYMRTRYDENLPDVPHRNVEFLVIDDLCSEIVTSVIRDQAGRLIDYRIGRGVSTVITTNLSFTRVEELYGERIASRLCRDKARFVAHDIAAGTQLLTFENRDFDAARHEHDADDAEFEFELN